MSNLPTPPISSTIPYPPSIQNPTSSFPFRLPCRSPHDLPSFKTYPSDYLDSQLPIRFFSSSEKITTPTYIISMEPPNDLPPVENLSVIGYIVNPTITKTKEVVIDTSVYWLGISQKAEELYLKYKQEENQPSNLSNIPRDDPILHRVIRELGKEANPGACQYEFVRVRDEPGWSFEVDFHIRDEYTTNGEFVREYFTTSDGKWKFYAEPVSSEVVE